uniref:SCP domain-containing protein n=1 Tax=Strongyloides venezuelensis TaxID=75913 RepID=A0A0K0FN12_STRVS
MFSVSQILLQNRYFFYFNKHSFANEEDLLEYISLNNPQLVNKEVHIEMIGKINRYLNIPIGKPIVYKVCLQPVNRQKSTINKKKVRIPEGDVTLKYTVDGKSSYECDNRRVPTLRELARCAMLKHRVSFGPTCQKVFKENKLPLCIKEKSVEDDRKPFCEAPNVMYLYNLDEKFKKNHFSNKVWSEIWKNKYDYQCFSYKNFYLLKQRFILELNTYRGVHKAKPLTEHFELSKIAQRRAERIAESGKIFPRVDKYFEEVAGKSEILLAPFMIKKWYEEVSEYNFRNPFSKKRPQNFVKIMWRSTTYYGIGITKINCDLIVVLIFKAKKRNSRRYFLNVKRSKRV